MLQLNFNPFPELMSQRLRLRRIEADDFQQVYSLRSDERVNFFLDRKPALSEDDAKIFIDKIIKVIEKNEGAYWAICLKENPKLIGTVCFFDFSSITQSAEIGYELLPFYQHKGIMHEALSVVIPYGFQSLELKSITACPTADNLSSIKLLERNGFLLEDDGVERKDNLVKYVLREKPPGLS